MVDTGGMPADLVGGVQHARVFCSHQRGAASGGPLGSTRSDRASSPTASDAFCAAPPPPSWPRPLQPPLPPQPLPRTHLDNSSVSACIPCVHPSPSTRTYHLVACGDFPAPTEAHRRRRTSGPSPHARSRPLLAFSMSTANRDNQCQQVSGNLKELGAIIICALVRYHFCALCLTMGCSDPRPPLLSQNSQSSISAPQVGIAVATYAAAAGAMLLLFQIMRPSNRIVYEPKLKYADGRPSCPPMGINPFGWLPPLWRMKENDLLPIIGLDAVAYLRFVRMMRWCLTAIGLVMCAVLIPIDVMYNVDDRDSSSSTSDDNNHNFLFMITMRDVHGADLWAHVVMSYFGTFVALGFLWFNWRHMIRLRWDWFRSPEYQDALYARTLLITHVPAQMRSDEALHGVLQRLKMPYPTTEVFIGRDMGLLPDLIDRHQILVRKLERALVWYLRSPTTVRSRRPTTRLGGFLGMGGRKVDSIDYYSDQIEQVEASIMEWRQRIAEKGPVSYGFASTGAVHYAHAAARSLRRKRPHGLKIQLAPPPNAIIWRNLTLDSWQRFRSSLLGFVLLTALLFLNAVPLTGVNLISNMSLFASDNVQWTGGSGSGETDNGNKHHALVPFLHAWYTSSHLSFAAVAGILPPLISAIAGWLLPISMRRLAKYRGITSKIKTDRVILGQYYGYLVISQLIVFTLIGVVINLIALIVSSVKKSVRFADIISKMQLPQTIQQQYFALGNYWLTWMPLKVMLVLLDLAQVIKLVFVWLQKGLFSKTPRDVRELTEPPFFEYSNYYANVLFVGAVAMVYATLSPLIVVLGAIVCWTYSIANKYQLMYVNQTKHEAGGDLWPAASNRFLINVLFMQVILVLAVLLEDVKTGYRAVACLPPILGVLVFKIYIRRAFERKYEWYIPDAEEAAQVRVHHGDSRHRRLERRFGHPYLSQKLWTPMVHARMQGLLPQVYHGRIDESKVAVVDGRKVETAAIDGGFKIAFVEEDQLEYDPRKDDDTRSILSATTLSTGLGPTRQHTGPSSLGAGYYQDQFQHQYAQYLAAGPGGPAEEYEMGSLYGMADPSTLGKGTWGESKEGLLQPDYGMFSSTPISVPMGRAESATSAYDNKLYQQEQGSTSQAQLAMLPYASRTTSPAPMYGYPPSAPSAALPTRPVPTRGMSSSSVPISEPSQPVPPEMAYSGSSYAQADANHVSQPGHSPYATPTAVYASEAYAPDGAPSLPPTQPASQGQQRPPFPYSDPYNTYPHPPY